MSKKIIILVVMVGFMLNLNATIWRVNNRIIHGNPIDADFTTLQDAIDGAADGDTIYVEGGYGYYGEDIIVNKMLVIKGPGYFLNINDSTQASKRSAIIEGIRFVEGSQGSIIEGISILKNPSNYLKCVDILVDSIAIRRCYLNVSLNNSNYYGFYCNANNDTLKNILIQQNYISVGSGVGLSLQGKFIRSKIANNIIISDIRSLYIINGNSLISDLLIANNILKGAMYCYYSTHINNILFSGNMYGSGNLTSHNICNETQYPNENNNQQNVNMSTVFVNYNGITTNPDDNDFILASSSPAIGAGVNGVDCGAFGGDYVDVTPYILSGMPESMPAIFDASVEHFGVDEINVNIKAISHNGVK